MAQNRIVVPVPAPRNFLQWPWREIALATIILVAAGILVYSGVNWIVSRASENTTAPAVPAVQQQVAAPVVSRAPGPELRTAPVAVAPTAILLTLRWEEYDLESNRIVYYAWGIDEQGVIRNNTEYVRTVTFLGTGTTKDAIVYTQTGTTVRRDDILGDLSGTPYNPEFSPDKGKTWFVGENIPAGALPSFTQVGAVFDGDDILILANMQYEPWKYRHYIARVTPQDTKRASH